MNQWYTSPAVYTDDEIEDPPKPTTEHERTMNLYESTYPGYRVPHLWLALPTREIRRRLPMVSTRDIVGHGRFTILTGIGGKPIWLSAAKQAREAFDVEVEVHSIGWGQDYEDTYFRWFDKRGIEENGAVLVRPDRTVAWRCKTSPPDERICGEKLTVVLKRVLGYEEKLTNGNGVLCTK